MQKAKSQRNNKLCSLWMITKFLHWAHSCSLLCWKHSQLNIEQADRDSSYIQTMWQLYLNPWIWYSRKALHMIEKNFWEGSESKYAEDKSKVMWQKFKQSHRLWKVSMWSLLQKSWYRFYRMHYSFIECTPFLAKEKYEKNMVLRARFPKLKGEPYYQWGLNSKRGRGELNSQRGADSQGLPRFSANVLCLWQHCYKLFISLCIF